MLLSVLSYLLKIRCLFFVLCIISGRFFIGVKGVYYFNLYIYKYNLVYIYLVVFIFVSLFL